MLKKYKQLITGIVIGALIFGAVPAGAAVKEYVLRPSTHKIIVDGVEFKDEKLPILFMEPGYNYIPVALFRKICEKIGASLEFDGAKGEIKISTGQAVKEEEEMSRQIEILHHNGKDYVELGLINAIYRLEFEKPIFTLRRTEEGTGEIDLLDKNDPNKVLISNIPYVDIPYKSSYARCVEYDYYINVMLPLIQ